MQLSAFLSYQRFLNLRNVQVVEIVVRVAAVGNCPVGELLRLQGLDIQLAAQQDKACFFKAGNRVDVGQGQTGFGNLVLIPTGGGAQRTNAYSLDDICDEWSREFYFEGRRRMDLIRFNRYGGNNNYTWQWKGGSYEGRSFDAHLNIFAIPTNELTANSNLTQNPGY